MRIARVVLMFGEVAILSALIVAPRCVNYQDVFVGGDIYFTDADCYARMTRVRMCAEHPGLIARHHDFENFPEGTNPHTTAPLDYLILGLASLLRPFTANALDLAGAWISPLLALFSGWFLWWWSRRMRFCYSWVLLILYASSPILVHGSELGRPDHQSLLMLLVTVGLCAEWSLHNRLSRPWAVVSGCAWALGIWVSAYEPLVLLLALLAISAAPNRQSLFRSDRHYGWVAFGAVLVLAVAIERRAPSMSILHGGQLFANWSRDIGELQPVPLFSGVWFSWGGYLIVLAPALFYLARRGQKTPAFVPVLLMATFALTIWQARWGYFFLLLFALALPLLLEAIPRPVAVWVAFGLSILPMARDWDARIWPNESENASRLERRTESTQLRSLAMTLRSGHTEALLAPWWLAPALVYWSGQPGVSGSSHEALDGTVDSARFYLTVETEEARKILLKRNVAWVFAYDAERVMKNSRQLVATSNSPAAQPLCLVLDRIPSRAPAFLSLARQTAAAKVYRITDQE